MKQNKLKPTYFQQSDVVFLAKDLIGKKIFTFFDGQLTGGTITETEAYAGVGDKACHAHLGRFTERTKVMYETGGISYIYLCYGIHHLFNIVTNIKGRADAILLRGFEPEHGIATMLKRRNKTKVEKNLSAGPGNVSQALGLTKAQNANSVCSNEIWLENGSNFDVDIVETTRIGIDYAKEDAELPWRFYQKDSKFVSVK
ncbi:DNA-3-methyladenine glycosylase [Psychroflexus aestuariivivens]|uniref:DNA-3-methyladenine glycosylase n=1 Tax=Psychroflexus aestuariivivens TaxID=1795040 RepID=UPI000FDBA3B7|nr:DNA-3-methyladenine glycosylase [Psychroflexus aestuariivivens]